MLRLQEEKDIEVLRQAALLLEAENKRLSAQVVELTRQLMKARGEDASKLQERLAVVEEQLARRNHQLFGPSTEKEHQPSSGKAPAEKTPRRGHGPREQPELLIEPVLHDLDEADKQCPKCGGELKEMVGQYEEAEEIDVVERHFVIKKHQRKKYRCACNAHIETALGPPKLFEGARYSIDFAIEVAVQKYLDHLPLERQVRIMSREGLIVDSQTLWDYLFALVRLVMSAYLALLEYLRSREILGVDESRWWLLGLNGRECWYVWALAAPDAVGFLIKNSRSAEAAKQVLGDFAGILMADGYVVYLSLSKNGAAFILVHCWAHVRREFLESEAKFPQAHEVLVLISELYQIEASCSDESGSADRRLSERHEKSRPIVDRIKAWALDQKEKVLPESSLGKAIGYMLRLWEGLIRFLDDPRIPLDNNQTERELRGVVVGRKNHYGSHSEKGTEVAAVLYTLTESAKLVGINPKEYLRMAAMTALRGERIPLPHEVAAQRRAVGSNS